MSKRRKITRRDFLRVSALATAGAVAAACAGPATEEVIEPPEVEEEVPEVEEEAPAATAAPSESGYSEAPSLAALVEAGELPPVDERLPLEPMVVGPGVRIVEEHLDWEVGEYSQDGEVLRSVTTSPTWSYPCQHAIEHLLNTPEHHTGPITPNLFSSWSVNDDLTEYEFTLRKGLKWSDGEPVTTEDIRFTWEDVLLKEAVTPVLGRNVRAGADPSGEPMEVEFVDDFTFRCTFSRPNGRFLNTLGMGNLWTPYCYLLKPAHYLKQFHEDYVSEEEITAACEAEGLGRDEWHQMFLDKGAGWWGGGCEHVAEHPTSPWWLAAPGSSPPRAPSSTTAGDTECWGSGMFRPPSWKP
ncbi:MAG: ABC transporter substrate-binding protein [Longimicrobiales bacterium]